MSTSRCASRARRTPRNVAKGRKRRLKVTAPRRSYLDRAEHIQALLDAAGAMDAADGRRSLPWRRPLLSVLTFAGLRLDECLSLRWADVDLAGGRLKVKGTKTAAAARTIKLLPALRDELLAYAAAFGERDAAGLVFPTQRVGGRYAGGAKHTPSNIRNRVLAPAVELANAQLAKDGVEPLPEGLTPHSLRRTFASILVALSRDLAVIMRQMGHAGPEMTLGVYAAAMDWADGERERLQALVGESPEGQSEDKTASVDTVAALQQQAA